MNRRAIGAVRRAVERTATAELIEIAPLNEAGALG